MSKALLRIDGRYRPITRGEANQLGLTIEPLAPSYRAEHLGVVLDRSAWVELPLSRGWIVGFRICRQHGVPVVAELRCLPETPAKRPPGQWSGEYGSAEGVPAGGLTARHLRGVRFREFKQVLSMVLARWGTKLMELDVDLAQPKHAPSARPGRKGRTDHELARIAATYQRAYLANKLAVPAVAKRFHLDVSQARDAVYRARERGMLTPATKQGSAGGLLTSQARLLLKQRKKPKGGGKNGKTR